MPIDVANFAARNFGRGPDLAQIDQARGQNALLQNQVQQIPVSNALARQRVDMGNLEIANTQQQMSSQQQANARGVLANSLKAIAEASDPKAAATDIVSRPDFQSAAKFLGLPVEKFAVTDQLDPEVLRKSAGNLAVSLGVPPATKEGFTLGKEQVRYDAQGRQIAAGPADSDVSWHDAGDKLVPLLKNGQPAPGIAPIPKQTPPGQQYTQDSVENTAQMIYRNQMPMLSGFALKSPWGQQVLSRVGELSKQGEGGGGDAYSAGTFAQRSKAMRDFATGAPGNSVRFMNVAISHINVLEQLGQALDNGDIQALNKFKNAWKTETGQAIPTSFNAARDIVANEVVKAVTASGGGVADRQEAQAQISSASSWQQIADVAQTWKQLLAGQLSGLKLQYEQGTGLKDFNKKLYPETLKELGGLETTQPAAAGGWTIRQVGQ